MKFKNVALSLIGINVVVFILQYLIGDAFTLLFRLDSSLVLSRPWTLITMMFLHGSPMHLLFNMYALFIFGPMIEQRIGGNRFLFIYLVSGFLASLVAVFIYPAALGASGAIMAILGVTIMLMPHLKVLFFFVIPMSLRTAGIIFALIDVFGIIVPDGVANVAHLVGLACGLGFGYYLIKQRVVIRQAPKKHGTFEEKIHLSNQEVEDYLRNGRL